MSNQKNLSAIFSPKSIAIVGASTDPKKLGTVLLQSLIDGGYQGQIIPINPKYDEILGHKCYKSVAEVPGGVDQVAILIPAPFVLDVMKDCAKAKVKTVLIISAGFGETGAEGAKLEAEIVKVAHDNDIRIVGPNIIGAINPLQNMNSSWMQALPEKGDIAFVSQSGAFCTTVLDVALTNHLGFSNFCSIGNKADVNEADLIEFWNDSPEVKVIAAYVEEITNGLDLTQYLEKDLKKPLVIFKPGKSNEAKAAISSHTGSMAGSYETVKTALDKAGAIQVDNTRDFFNAIKTFSWSESLPTGRRVAVITNAGGPGIMCTDDIVQYGLQLAQLNPQTQADLKAALPAAASNHNPVDVLGEAPADRYQAAAQIVAQDKNVDIILFLLTPQYVTDPEGTAQIIIDLEKQHPEKIVAAVFMGDKFIAQGLDALNQAHVPAFTEVDSAVKSLAWLCDHADRTRARDQKAIAAKYDLLKNKAQGKYQKEVQALLAKTKAGEVIPLPDEMMDLLAAEVGFDLPKQTLTSSLAEAKKFCTSLYPVVIKAPNKTIAHKTDVKAVYVGLKNEEELTAAYTELENTIKSAAQVTNPEILIQEMIISKEELFVGANRDDSFGHLIVMGKGGIYTEVYKDLAYALVPADTQEIKQALLTTKTSQILEGTRGQTALATDKMVETIAQVQKLLILYPQIASLDINPVLMTETRAVSVDIKVFLSN